MKFRSWLYLVAIAALILTAGTSTYAAYDHGGADTDPLEACWPKQTDACKTVRPTGTIGSLTANFRPRPIGPSVN